MNDSTWRSLSAILGLACVVMIIAAGALLMTSGEASSSPTPQPTSIASIDQPSDSPSDSTPPGSPDASASGKATATPILPIGSPSIQTNAPSAAIAFQNLQLDSQNDPLGKPRTFTFITDGFGKIGASFTTVSPSNSLSTICLSLDGGKPTCVRTTHYAFSKATTDTAHSVWTVTMQGYQGNRPIVNLSMSWPSNKPRITLTHGRFQGSSSPNVPEAVNGFTASITPKVAGNIALSAAWTGIATDARVTIDQSAGSSSSLLDQKQYSAVQNLGTPGYSFAVTPGHSYRLALRNLAADSGHPDLTATISMPWIS